MAIFDTNEDAMVSKRSINDIWYENYFSTSSSSRQSVMVWKQDIWEKRVNESEANRVQDETNLVHGEKKLELEEKMKSQYVLPELGLEAFNCPNCQVYTQQLWSYLEATSEKGGLGIITKDTKFLISKCVKCEAITIWHNRNIVYPYNSTVEPPNNDLPADIKDDYNEAASISNFSPRAAAALLRLCIQKICIILGESGKDLCRDIGCLVKNGLPSDVQKALDCVRVIGNEAVHPGVIDFKDDRDIANKLFKLVNFIAQKMISEPKELEDLYHQLPKDKLEGIEKRDKKR
jgi:hypothetical protein